jgi:hypothetical protein
MRHTNTQKMGRSRPLRTMLASFSRDGVEVLLALLALGLPRRGRRHEDSNGRDEGHFHGQRGQDAEGRAQTEILDGGQAEGRQGAEAERGDGAGREHDHADLGGGFDDRVAVLLDRCQFGSGSAFTRAYSS